MQKAASFSLAGAIVLASSVAAAAQPVGPNANAAASPSSMDIVSSSNDAPSPPDLYDHETAGRHADAAFGAHVGEWNALAPRDVYGALLFVEWGEHGRLWSNVFRVSVSRTLPRAVVGDVGAGAQDLAKFTFTTAQFEGCPLWVPVLSRDVIFRPCLFVGGGIVEAKGEVAPTESHTRPWAYVGGLFRLRYQFDRHFAVEAQTGLQLPVIRERFGRGDGTPDVYQADTWIPFGSVGLAVVL